MPPPATPAFDIERIAQGFRKMGEAYAAHVREHVLPAIKRMDAALWRVYREAGAPYGESADGRLRWFTEQSAKQHYVEGDRVLCTAEHVEREGVIVALWPNGSCYVRTDDGEVVACGVEALARP